MMACGTGFPYTNLLDAPFPLGFPPRKFRYWQIGIVVFILGNLANFASFGMQGNDGYTKDLHAIYGILPVCSVGFAAQSLLAALGSVQFVSNVIFAYFVLKEKVREGS